MAIKIRTAYMSSFNMPHFCAACSNPSSPGAYSKVKKSKSSGSSVTSLTVEFLLCQECYDVSKDKRIAKVVSWLGLLLALGACLIGGAFASDLVDNPTLGIGIGAVLLIAVIFLTSWLSNLINQQGMTPEQRQRRHQTKDCVKISSFKEPGGLFSGVPNRAV